MKNKNVDENTFDVPKGASAPSFKRTGSSARKERPAKLRIAVLGTRGFPSVQGGVETHCEHLYPLLVEAGCEVTVFAREPYVGKDAYEYKGVKVVPIFCPKKKAFEAIAHTFLGVLEAKKIKPDVLHIHAVGPALLVPFAKLLGIRVVMTNHGPDYDRQKWGFAAKMMLRLGEFLGSVFADEVITISKTIEGIIRKHSGRNNVHVIPNGVVIPEPAKEEETLRKYGLEKRKYILAVGRFVPEKAFDYLIKAFQARRIYSGSANESASPANENERPNEFEGIKLVIVGDADHEDEYSTGLKALAAKNPDVVLTGFLKGDPLHELYSHAQVFVLPSFHEGLPIVLLEALSYGLSCIASDIPANLNVDLGEDRFFEAGNVDALAAKLREFVAADFTDEQRLAQIEMVREKYDWKKIAQETLRVFRG